MTARARGAARRWLVLAALGAAAASASFAARPVPPGPGIFLVAGERIAGGPFFRSVVLVLVHGDGGTLGVIVNRPTEVPLSKALPDLETTRRDPVVFFGGPVGLDRLLFLFRSDRQLPGSLRVMDDLYFSGDRKLLEELLAREDEPDLRVYLGHAGWAPRQLDGEIARGDWRLLPADAPTVFRDELDGLWQELFDRERSTVVAAAR